MKRVVIELYISILRERERKRETERERERGGGGMKTS